MSINKNNRFSMKSVTIDSKDPMLFSCGDPFDDDTPSEISISSEEEVGSGSDCDQRVRARPIQEIWDKTSLSNSLMSLDQADKIIQLIHAENYEGLINYENYKNTGLLISTWLGNETATKWFLLKGAKVNTIDSGGRTPLHLAANSRSYQCLKLLLDANAQVTVWDAKHRVTPIHCAASKGSLACIKLLISRGADVNAGLSTRSPLHYAVESVAPDCVKELLQAGAIPNTPQVFTEAPIHVAAAMGSPEIVELLIKHGAAVSVRCGPDKTTALHLAAEDGNLESTSLLINAGANIMAVNNRHQTPLHLATLAQSTDTLQLLLNRGADPNVTDQDGRTPLHGAIAKASRCDCVKLLLSAGANVNKPDDFGYTPLHLAALNEFSHYIMMLINHGGDVTARTNGGISVLTFITRRTPDVIPKYLEKFNSSIKLNDHELGDVDCELKLDFRVLVPSPGKGETELLLNFIEVGHREILKHPLCETFLFLKWKRIRKFFLFSLFYHTLFVMLFTGYSVGVFLRDCPFARSMLDSCSVPFPVRLMGYILIVLNIFVMAKEVFQLAHNWQGYIKQWENWLQLLIIVSVLLCVFPTYDMDIRNNVHNWQHHIAAIGIFIAWLELMMIVGRFPMFGLYVQMFTTVALNFSKFLLVYSCLLIAFSLCFGVLFANYPAFQNMLWGILKTVIMMSGELEFEDMFYDPEAEIVYPITSQIMFFAFVLLVTLILSNLMVGLAVSDIQGLQQSAGLDRLVRQAELVAHLESMLFSRLLSFAPRRLLRFFYKHALLLKTHQYWALYVRPNDPREERIPKDLIKNIYHLVADHKEKLRAKNRRSRRKSRNKYSYDFQDKHPKVSRLSSNMSTITSNLSTSESTIKEEFEALRKQIMDWNDIYLEKINKIGQVLQVNEVSEKE